MLRTFQMLVLSRADLTDVGWLSCGKEEVFSCDANVDMNEDRGLPMR